MSHAAAGAAHSLHPPVHQTSPAVNRCVVFVPSPSWPLPLAPQQYAAPVAVTPQVWKSPAPTAAKLTPAGACTSTGVDRFVVTAPSPSRLPRAPPQQEAMAAARTSQGRDTPAAAATARTSHRIAAARAARRL